MRDHPTAHEVDEKRTDSRFDDMSAKHRDHTTPVLRRVGNCRDDSAEVARDEHVGQRAKEVGERQIAAERRLCEFVG
jgi:hypothetical protein